MSSPRPSWLDRAMLVIFVLVVFSSRLNDLSIRGEESRWARIAIEMMHTGDWVVPREQGEPFLSRPPLRMWMTAAVAYLRGDCDALAVRLPSIIAVAITALVIRAYASCFLGRLGALAAGLAYASMAQVLELGPLGETEAVFAMFVSASLLLWRRGVVRRWPMWRTWSAAYLCVALGALTKGIQAPVYYAAAIGLYLLITRQWRLALTAAHLAGIAVFIAVLAPWHVLLYRQLGWGGIWDLYTFELGVHAGIDWPTLLKNLVRFPAWVMACLLPWSPLLLLLLRRDLRAGLGAARAECVFLLCCLVATAPMIWLQTGVPRHYLSMYPCLAALIGVAVDRSTAVEATPGLRRAWRVFPRTAAAAAMVGGAGVFVLAFLPASSLFRQPMGFAAFCLVGGTVAGMVLWRAAGDAQPVRRVDALFLIAATAAVAVAGVFTNYLVNRSTDAPVRIAQLRGQIKPPDVLVSIGPVHHLFTYHYRDPLPLRSVPRDLRSGDRWVCVKRLTGRDAVRLDGEWDLVMVVPVDRFRYDPPREEVAVYRRR